MERLSFGIRAGILAGQMEPDCVLFSENLKRLQQSPNR